MYSDGGNRCSHRLGFPIRKSPDHSLLAASRSLSQLITSFFAYLRQGIHTHALSSLTIKSTSHTFLCPPLHRPCPAFTRNKPNFRADGRRYFLCAYIQNLCFVCPSIFSCQRSRLLQQSVEHPFYKLLKRNTKTQPRINTDEHG
jgi:hypothetical protein